ncbi:Phage tail protein (Tail_P2_I) [Nostoc sp. PCC 7524]|uniref:phage tail protein n=1 Tax=Nostoc sp. (strain ATCC 29411 / PCC 7524) TaxID=28072 RepID=UPI00029F4BB7|nr:phage tail protein [Nostoc sp. PCC 7524]AFY49020.1 Phage tail protein (Tail_P2_I) [Nostoc sp. PCC 7524]
MQTQIAWQTGRPIFSRLPEVYQENAIANYLTAFWDELLVNNKARIDDLPRQLNPLTCDANWLDFLAPLCGFTGEYWDRKWQDNFKRNLIASSYQRIWSNKGSRECLSTVLICFKIPHNIATMGDFILGQSKLGVDPLGSLAFKYIIYLRSSYQGTPEVKLVEKLNKLFGPCWCKSEVIFDDSVVSMNIEQELNSLLLSLMLT